jgi:CheY-like chemotaxis protein
MPTALIVEDEPEANRLLAMLVRLRGYQTDSAFTGGEALEKVEHRPPDIVFLDLMLPDINGYEVCKRLKAGRETTLIPVVMVTARVASENRYQSYSAGADDYIPKPYTPDQIFQAISDADAWRRDLARRDDEGEIAFRSDSDEVLRELARLRSLLVARTPLSLESVFRIGHALEEIRLSASHWGKAHEVSIVATLDYQLQVDRVALTIRDQSGWLTDDPLPPERRWLDLLAPARFDEPIVEDLGRTLSLVRPYDAP